MSFLSSAPLPAFTLVLGCVTGLMSSHHVAPDTIATAPEPSAHAAVVDESAGPVEADLGSIGSKTIYRAPDGLFYVTAEVNGQPVRFLVDTGASVMVLRSADAAAVGAPMHKSNARIDGVGGSAAMAWTQIEDVAVGGHRIHGIRAAVARHGLSVSLLGQNLLSRMGKLKIEGDRLDLE